MANLMSKYSKQKYAIVKKICTLNHKQVRLFRLLAKIEEKEIRGLHR